MISLPIVFFRCEKCRREFDNREGAEKCEEAHLTIVSATVKSYTIRPFPYTVELTFNNGEKRIYLAEDLH